jgi:hypothetical protein
MRSSMQEPVRPVLLDGFQMAEFQACRRRWRIGREWRPARWNAKVLFDGCLRRMLLKVSGGGEAAAAIAEAKARFLESAASPGIESKWDPYVSAKDWAAMIETAGTAMAEMMPRGMRELDRVSILQGAVRWQPLAWETADGEELVRVVTAARIDEEFVRYVRRSWQTAGDMAVIDRPMTVWALAIGSERAGRRASVWTRAWRDPSCVNGKYHFATRSGKAPRNWKPYYFVDRRENDAETWVRKMRNEGAMEGMVARFRVERMEEREREKTLRDIGNVAWEMEAEGELPFGEVVMSRNECDGIVPCWAKRSCYGTGEIAPRELYLPRLNPSG